MLYSKTTLMVKKKSEIKIKEMLCCGIALEVVQLAAQQTLRDRSVNCDQLESFSLPRFT
jgi:hypothetical protein